MSRRLVAVSGLVALSGMVMVAAVAAGGSWLLADSAHASTPKAKRISTVADLTDPTTAPATTAVAQRSAAAKAAAKAAAAKAAAKQAATSTSSDSRTGSQSTSTPGITSGALQAAMAAVLVPAPTSHLYVSTSGSDSNSGTSSSSPKRTVQAAVDLARPGTAIMVSAGTYTGQIKIRTSGTAAAPIVLMASGNGTVNLTYASKAVSCSNNQPAPDRTVMVSKGADYWRIAGMTITNGVYISGQEVNTAYSYLTDRVKSGDWASRRAIPGRGTNDPTAARTAISYLASKTGKTLDPSDGIQVVGNTITGRGIHAAMSRYGLISANQIHAINCGTGPGVWLITFSDGWTVANNHVYDVRASSYAHFMQEGIRIGSSSDYNVVSHNLVEDLPGDGRGYNTDTDSSFNTIQDNVANGVATGFNEQMSGWGNTWQRNSAIGFRTYGFGFRLMDASLSKPSKNSSSYQAIVRCNTATGTGKALGVGGIMNATFTGNSFTSAWISKNSASYWGSQGNTWNGSSAAPGKSPPVGSRSGC